MWAKLRKYNSQKCQKKGRRWSSCLREPTFCLKSQQVKLAQKKFRNAKLFETNLDPSQRKIATFWGKGGTINFHITYPPLICYLAVIYIPFFPKITSTEFIRFMLLGAQHFLTGLLQNFQTLWGKSQYNHLHLV